MAYTTQYGLPQNVVNYLNQQLPTADIYGGITSVPFTFDDVAAEQQIEAQAATGLTPEQLLLLQTQNTGGDGPMGGGAFGNLDMDTAKQFNIGGNIVTGYKNLNTGLYQDINGLNIQNLGLRTIPGITGILDNIFGPKEPTYPGLFDKVSYKALIKNPYLAKSFFDRQDVEKQQELQDEIVAYNLEKAKEVQPYDYGGRDTEYGTHTATYSKSDAEINRDRARGRQTGGDGNGGNSGGSGGEGAYGGFCFDPNTPIQMADGSTKKIKNIQLGDNTKGGEVTGVFQFKAADEIHNYKGVTVAGSHYVKEDGKFIMVKDSPIAIKIDKIPVVYSLDTSGRRIFIKDIEFADYNGDGIAKNFLNNAGVDLSGFDKEVLRQVENRIL